MVYVHPSGRWYTVEFNVVPVIQKMMKFGNTFKMGTEKGKPVKIREAFFAPVAVPAEIWENPRAGYRGRRCEA